MSRLGSASILLASNDEFKRLRGRFEADANLEVAGAAATQVVLNEMSPVPAQPVEDRTCS